MIDLDTIEVHGRITRGDSSDPRPIYRKMNHCIWEIDMFSPAKKRRYDISQYFSAVYPIMNRSIVDQ
jgi:hypothetical protein